MKDIRVKTTEALTEIDTTLENLRLLNNRMNTVDFSETMESLLRVKWELEKQQDAYCVDYVIDKLDYFDKDDDFYYEHELHENDSVTIKLNGVYSFLYKDSKQLNSLIRFIKYVYRDHEGVQQESFLYEDGEKTTHSAKRISEALSETVSDRTLQIQRGQNMVTAVEQPHWTSGNDKLDRDTMEVVSTETIDTRLNDIDEEARKQQNIDHLKAVKDKVDKRAENVRTVKFTARVQDMEQYLLELVDTKEFSKYVREWLLNEENDKLLNIISFTNMARDRFPAIDNATARILIETQVINLSNKLLRVNKFVETDKSLYVPISAIDKEYLVALTLNNLDLVTKHQQSRDYDISNLAVYIVTYCGNNSSLTIAETPEEIVRLVDLVYGIFLSKNLNPTIVNDIDVNSQNEVADPKWFKSNKVIQSYLDTITYCFPKNRNKETLDKVQTIINRRDRMMTSQRLSPVDVSELFNELLLLESAGDAKCAHGDEVYAIGGFYDTGDGTEKAIRTVFIVATPDCICVIIKMSEGSYMQEFYNETTTLKLVRWLDFLTSKLTENK